MTSISRSRERDVKTNSYAGLKTVVSEFYWNGTRFGDPSTSNTVTGAYAPGHETCQDRLTISGNYQPNSLSIEKRTGFPCSLNGTYSDPETAPSWGNQYHYEYSGYFGSRLGSMWSTGIQALPAADQDYWLTEFLSRTSLATPIFDTPLFLWELRELPRLLKYTGDILVDRKVAGSPGDAWLAYNFGWAPLFSDLLTLINFAESSQRHFKRLLTATVQGREQMLLAKADARETVGSPFLFETLTIQIMDHIRQRVWATGEWVLDDPYKVSQIQQIVSSGPNSFEHLRYTLGLRVNRATIWNMIPWSWLIDYLGNIGSFLEATDNRIGASLKNVCIMVHTRGDETSEVISNPKGLSFESHLVRRERKERFVYLEPSATLRLHPILSTRRLSNIAALLTASRIRARYH